MKEYQYLKNYNIQDFLDDDFFIDWVVNPTNESNQFWKGFLHYFPEKNREINNSKSIIKAFYPMDKELSAFEKEALWNCINESTIGKKTKQRKLIYQIAAACAIVAILSGSIYLFVYEGMNKEINYANIKAPVSVSDEIKLIMADSSEINISKSESEFKYDSNGKLLVNSQLLDVKKAPNSNGAKAFNQLVVPRGKRSSIIFSDGTKLWLNSGSRAIYPVEFESRKREVFIEGEAYLEVTHDEDRPFILKTDKIDIQVLGTSFNISAYPEDRMTNVVLVRGSVKAMFKNKKKCLLTPNQMVMFNQQTDRVEVKAVDVFEHISWKEGWLLCNSEKLENVFTKLSRYYNREIRFADEKAKSFQLSGKLDLKDNLDQVLHIISSTAPVSAKIINEQIIISSK